jgi:hypothetical protein
VAGAGSSRALQTKKRTLGTPAPSPWDLSLYGQNGSWRPSIAATERWRCEPVMTFRLCIGRISSVPVWPDGRCPMRQRWALERPLVGHPEVIPARQLRADLNRQAQDFDWKLGLCCGLDVTDCYHAAIRRTGCASRSSTTGPMREPNGTPSGGRLRKRSRGAHRLRFIGFQTGLGSGCRRG